MKNQKIAQATVIASAVALSYAGAWNIAARISGISDNLSTAAMVTLTSVGLLAGAIVGLAIVAKSVGKQAGGPASGLGEITGGTRGRRTDS